MPHHLELARLGRYAPLPILWVAASGAAVAGVGGASLAMGVAAVGALALAGSGLVWLEARASLRELEARRAAGRHRFLCPHCLCFGPFTYGCGQCGAEVEGFVVHTGGLYFTDCNRCRAPVFPKPTDREQHQLQARCVHCGLTCDLRHHERAVRVVATLHARDFERVSVKQPAGRTFPGPPRHFCLDEGGTLTCLLDLRMPQQALEHLPEDHVATRVQAVWLDPARFTPLELGRALDSLLRLTTATVGRRSRVAVCLARDVDDPHVIRLLDQRFRGWSVVSNPAEMLPQGRTAPVVSTLDWSEDPPTDPPDAATLSGE